MISYEEQVMTGKVGYISTEALFSPFIRHKMAENPKCMKPTGEREVVKHNKKN